MRCHTFLLSDPVWGSSACPLQNVCVKCSQSPWDKNIHELSHLNLSSLRNTLHNSMSEFGNFGDILHHNSCFLNMSLIMGNSQGKAPGNHLTVSRHLILILELLLFHCVKFGITIFTFNLHMCWNISNLYLDCTPVCGWQLTVAVFFKLWTRDWVFIWKPLRRTYFWQLFYSLGTKTLKEAIFGFL